MEKLFKSYWKAKASVETTDIGIFDHFVDVNKTLKMPKGAEKIIPDIMLTRYACYLIVQNGDPRKKWLLLVSSILQYRQESRRL